MKLVIVIIFILVFKICHNDFNQIFIESRTQMVILYKASHISVANVFSQ